MSGSCRSGRRFRHAEVLICRATPADTVVGMMIFSLLRTARYATVVVVSKPNVPEQALLPAVPTWGAGRGITNTRGQSGYKIHTL